MSMQASTSSAQPLLDVRNVSKRFGGVEALKDVSLQLYPGEVVALAGDNGAGKSTLTKTISGVYPADEGEIRLAGETVRFTSPEAARGSGIETIYQDLALADNLSIGANIFLGREPMRRAFGFLPVLDRRRMAEAAKATMAQLDFHVERLDAPVGRFSGGQRQAVAIGRAMYWNARVILMDEPTAALGVPEQRKVISLVKALKAQGRGVIFISHNLQDIFAVSDRIVVLRRGSLAGERRIENTNHDEVVKLMIGG
jgi:simple sugar transport system ATP-binding protein